MPGGRQHLIAQSVENSTILPWLPDTDDGAGPEPLGPRAMVMADGYLWVGGQFTTVNEAAQQGLTRFGSVDTGAPQIPILRATSLQSGKVLVTWIASWDRDDDAVTYELFRDGVLVHQVTAQSREWLQPTLLRRHASPWQYS